MAGANQSWVTQTMCTVIKCGMTTLMESMIRQYPQHCNDVDLLTHRTPLTYALLVGNMECARLLLEGGEGYGADVDKPDGQRYTALCFACIRRDAPAVCELLDVWKASLTIYKVGDPSPLRQLYVRPVDPEDEPVLQFLTDLLLSRGFRVEDKYAPWDAARKGLAGCVRSIKRAMVCQDRISEYHLEADYSRVMFDPQMVAELGGCLGVEHVPFLLRNNATDMAVAVARHGGALWYESDITAAPMLARGLLEVLARAAREEGATCRVLVACRCRGGKCGCALSVEGLLKKPSGRLPPRGRTRAKYNVCWRLNGAARALTDMCMGLHPRLGGGSPVSLLDSHILSNIASLLSENSPPISLYIKKIG